MSSTNEKRLPWRIEAFREYLTFETLQQAAAVLTVYDGEIFDIRNPRIIEMQNLLIERTSKNSWIPNRKGSQDINWNVEGDVTRNKGRVFTSMLILRPKEWTDGTVSLTSFGRALGAGQITRGEYYDFILTRFKYPHPAWDDNWDAWKNSDRELYPFIYILQTLLALYKIGHDQAYLSTEEVADYLHPNPNHDAVAEYAKNIVNARQNSTPSITKRSDSIHRKISDILGFLCLTKYCYFVANNVYLNLMDLHQKERSNFLGKRKGQDKLKKIVQLTQSVP